MKKYFLLLLLALFCNFSFAQNNFRHGFIVLNNGDTVQCDIAADLAIELKDRVRIRQKGSPDIIVYTPDKVSAFQFDLSNTFASVTIEGKSIFLARLVEGYLGLYVFPRASNSSIYYLKTHDGTLVKLVNTVSDVQIGER